MGLKRFLDEEDFQELSFKHPKQLDSTEHLTSLEEINHSFEASQKAVIPGEDMGICCESLSLEGSKDNNSKVVSDSNDEEFETSAPMSRVSSSTNEEDGGYGAVFCSSVFPEYFEFNYPREKLIPFEDTYSSLLDSSPRKLVPIGPDHQADIPAWDPDVIKKQSISSSVCGDNDDKGEVIKKACVIPMPDFDFLVDDVVKGKDGKLDCRCLDSGSVKCVQQHVKEAREELKETIGLEKFKDLGFFEMGEEVAHKWTEEEEQLFHEVVYSNPVFHGKNFWVHLSTTFPSREKRELVSYYFNVFMLRKRAAQNRSSWLEIDSDDDECRGNGGGTFGVKGEDDFLFINQDVRVDHGDDSQNEYDDDDENDNNDDDDATENAEWKYHMAKEKGENSLDDSCTSFECQPHMTGSYYPTGERDALQESKVDGAQGKFFHGNSEGYIDSFGPPYALEPCDAKVWDGTYSAETMKSADLLPTCNMMDEIFGSRTWNCKSSNDKSIS